MSNNQLKEFNQGSLIGSTSIQLDSNSSSSSTIKKDNETLKSSSIRRGSESTSENGGGIGSSSNNDESNSSSEEESTIETESCKSCGNNQLHLIEILNETEDNKLDKLNSIEEKLKVMKLMKTIKKENSSKDTVVGLEVVEESKVRSSSVKSTEFDRFSLPTQDQLQAAANCTVVGESGQSILFSTLIHQRGTVVVVFLRHLWCGLCQQYVEALQSLSSTLTSESTSTTSTTTTTPPIYILLISSGSPSLIPIYRSRLSCPFPLYVDQSRTLYKSLGMTRKSFDGGEEKDKGSYIKGTYGENVLKSLKGSLGLVGRGLREGKRGESLKGGNQRQLGGEFVLRSFEEGKSIECVYASRMSTTRNHSEVRDLFAAAGVTLDPLVED